MRISWITRSLETPCVWYGKSKNNLNIVKCGKNFKYTSDDMCEPIAATDGYLDPGYNHVVILEGLSEDTKYFYQVGSLKVHFLMIEKK